MGLIRNHKIGEGARIIGEGLDVSLVVETVFYREGKKGASLRATSSTHDDLNREIIIREGRDFPIASDIKVGIVASTSCPPRKVTMRYEGPREKYTLERI
jgi:hypothetical protein